MTVPAMKENGRERHGTAIFSAVFYKCLRRTPERAAART